MRISKLAVVVVLLSVCLMAQSNQQAAPAATDVYHVHFAKAALGQAKAMESELSKPDPKAPMPGHFLVLRHQDGDDWDYAVIEHLGKKFTIDPAQYSAPTGPAIQAWHTDTIVVGPSWDVFTKEMGLGADAAKTAGSVYVLATWRAAPGHRQQLEKQLTTPPSGTSKAPNGDVVLMHLEGGPWNFLTLERYNSWQDYASYEAATQDGAGWYEIRNDGAWHHDTIATRVGAAK